MSDVRYFSESEARELTRRILSLSEADEARVNLTSGESGNTRFAVNQISTAGDTYDANAVIHSTFGGRTASVTTNRFDDESLREAVAMSERIARLTPEDPEHMPVLGPQSYRPVHAYFESTAGMDPEVRARAAAIATEHTASRGLESAGFLIRQAGASAVATSNGLFAYHPATSVAYTLTVRTPDGDGSGWAGGDHQDWDRIDPERTAHVAAEKAEQSRDAGSIGPGDYTVVLEPTAVGNLILRLGGALSARAADEGRSFFSRPGGGNRIGEKVVDERVTLWTDPADPEILSPPFDSEGLPAPRSVWFQDGVVQNLAYDRYWASQQEREPTASPWMGLRMSGGDASMDDMIASVERGILVTRFWYIRAVDARTVLYTGLTRDGTFLIENGRISRPVQNLRFNESPVAMLQNIEAMGRPVRVSASESGNPSAGIVVPPLLVRNFTFTSVSEAV